LLGLIARSGLWLRRELFLECEYLLAAIGSHCRDYINLMKHLGERCENYAEVL
jgi:hypothetical protein